MPYTYEYPRPGLTVDTAIVSKPTSPNDKASLLLIKRKHDPYKDCWALPGGFVDEYEHLNDAAARELQEETSIDPSKVQLEQVESFGGPARDPRGWTVTVAYACFVDISQITVKAADDAKEAQWFDVAELPKLAFDHKLVVKKCLMNLAERKDTEVGISHQLRDAAARLTEPWIPS